MDRTERFYKIDQMLHTAEGVEKRLRIVRATKRTVSR